MRIIGDREDYNQKKDISQGRLVWQPESRQLKRKREPIRAARGDFP
jgi:hypothetical protein